MASDIAHRYLAQYERGKVSFLGAIDRALAAARRRDRATIRELGDNYTITPDASLSVLDALAAAHRKDRTK